MSARIIACVMPETGCLHVNGANEGVAGQRTKPVATLAHECRNCGAPAGMAKAGVCHYCGVRILPDLAPWLDAVARLGDEVRRFCANPHDESAVDRIRAIRDEMAPGKPVFG